MELMIADLTYVTGMCLWLAIGTFVTYLWFPVAALLIDY